ncbi:DUF3891 family protein [Pricia sp.]|uniref:DUF3891 family protein n=1 Tax=Pricia sp. TaxID=2268138 RepID=UPI0035939F8C
MLVRHHPKGWKIISHYTHALLAGKIAHHLKHDVRHSHWTETLSAIINHDDNMMDFEEKNYLTDAGTPRDFMMAGGKGKDAVKHAKSLYKETLQKSQWINLLISRHIEFLYKDMPDEEMKQFLKEMHSKRKEQRKLYGINLDIEDGLYNLLRFCDRMSLILCGDEVPETERRLEINTSINEETYYIKRNDNHSFTIEPWIFNEEQFVLDFEYKILDQADFKSNKELQQCIQAARPMLQKITFQK